jgi:hypothetical protein
MCIFKGLLVCVFKGEKKNVKGNEERLRKRETKTEEKKGMEKEEEEKKKDERRR